MNIVTEIYKDLQISERLLINLYIVNLVIGF